MSITYPNSSARKKVITGSVLEVAAPRDADVYFKPTPTISKLIVILQIILWSQLDSKFEREKERDRQRQRQRLERDTNPIKLSMKILMKRERGNGGAVFLQKFQFNYRENFKKKP